MRRDLEARRRTWTRCTRGTRGVRGIRVVSIVLSLLFVGCVESPQGPRRLPPVTIPEQPTPPSPPPQPGTASPPTFTVRVEAVSTGVELDPDGYTVAIDYNPDEMLEFHVRDTVGTNGATDFVLGTGSYYASLLDIAPNCTAVPPEYVMFYVGSSITTRIFTLAVECLAIPPSQGVRVTTVTSGTFPDTASFRLWLRSDSGAVRPFSQTRRVGANETVTMPSPPGSFQVYLDTQALWQRCTVAPLYGHPVRVESNLMSALTFSIACTP